MDYANLTQDERDRVLQADLSEDKIRFLNKYKLISSPEQRWHTVKNQTPARLYFSHQFIKNNGMMEIVFRKYQFCYAKLKYFRLHLNAFSFYKHHPKVGFIETELWDAEFFRHKASGKIVDLRYLQQISDVTVFMDLMAWLSASELATC